jgi:uncharacterized protein (DUF983 family)
VEAAASRKFPVATSARAWYEIGMAGNDSFQTVAGETRSFPVACRYLWRAFRLQCPVCGRRPIFLPLRRVRGFNDWFTPLDGCPRCGYPYEREPGYFLLAVFGLNPGFTVFVAIVVFTVWANCYDLNAWPTWEFLLIFGVPIPIMNVLVARHAKAFFLALDHFVDPHSRDPDDGSDDDDDDGPPLIPEPTAGGGGGIHPDGHDEWQDEEPAGTAGRPREVAGRP